MRVVSWRVRWEAVFFFFTHAPMNGLTLDIDKDHMYKQDFIGAGFYVNKMWIIGKNIFNPLIYKGS